MSGPTKANSGIFLGFDFGVKKIGVSTGQSITRSASPLTTILNHNDNINWHEITKTIQNWKPQACIVGLPLHADQSESITSQKAKDFGEELSNRFTIPVYYVDEHLTTHSANVLCKDPLYKKHSRDAIAAMLILDTWLKGNFHVK
ncbi:MAG TPA: Holliday junction resolvase RuvX [Gammaproteobacteria bacterium]|nr:Holliday junction resolvase RuvX [Gammaproteobacteria bacterium]